MTFTAFTAATVKGACPGSDEKKISHLSMVTDLMTSSHVSLELAGCLLANCSAGPYLGDHGKVVDHVCVDDAVDDELAHVLPLGVRQVAEDVCVGLVGQQRVQQGHVAVLQHAVVVVDPRELVPRVDEEGVVQPCRQDSNHLDPCNAFLAVKYTNATLDIQNGYASLTGVTFSQMPAGRIPCTYLCMHRLCPRSAAWGKALAWVVHVMTQCCHHKRKLLTGCYSCSVCHQPDEPAHEGHGHIKVLCLLDLK